MRRERTRKCFSHRGQPWSSPGTSCTQPGRWFSPRLAGRASRVGSLACSPRLGDPMAASSKCSSGWLRHFNVLEGDTEGEGSHPPEVTDWRPHGLWEARWFYSVCPRSRRGGGIPAVIQLPQGGTKALLSEMHAIEWQLAVCSLPVLISPSLQSCSGGSWGLLCAKGSAATSLWLLFLSLVRLRPSWVYVYSCTSPPFPFRCALGGLPLSVL